MADYQVQCPTCRKVEAGESDGCCHGFPATVKTEYTECSLCARHRADWERVHASLERIAAGLEAVSAALAATGRPAAATPAAPLPPAPASDA